MQHRIILPTDLQATLDDIVGRNRARFGHDAFRMEADGGDAGGSEEGSGEGEKGGDGEAELGDAGKQAIDRMKAERNAERKRAAAAEAELEKLRNADKSEAEKAIDAARKEGATEATAKANARLVRAETKAIAAAAKFRDAGDVIAQLGDQLNSITVDDDGEVDQKALKSLVDDLAKRKPYLVDTGTTTATAADAGIGTTGSKGTVDTGPGLPRLQAAYATSSTTKS